MGQERIWICAENYRRTTYKFSILKRSIPEKEHIMRTWILAVALFGCRNEVKPMEEDTAVVSVEPVDNDGDGYIEDDCDDSNANVHPGVEELCDGIDNNCDG